MKRSPMVYILFFFSGITALIYEIVWTRMLTLVFGHTVFSVSVVLAAFMAGLGFGSYLFGYAIDRLTARETGGPSASSREGKNKVLGEDDFPPTPLLVYGWIEILVFATGALLSLFLANFSTVYAWIHVFLPDSVLLQNGLKALLAFGLILVPTTLMGATLPIISKYYVTDHTKLGTQVGFLYGINTLGAAFGCLLTGFLLISVLGVLETVLATSLVNLFIGISSIRIYQDTTGSSRFTFRLPEIRRPPLQFHGDQKLWMGVSFICGFTALAYEVLWTRLLVFSISSTVYSFSMMLAVFLLGIVLGSLLVVPILSRGTTNLRSVLLALQAGVGLYVIFSIYGIETILSPPWNSYNLENPAATFFRYFMDSVSLMLVPTLLLGMSFPILIKIVSGGPEHVGRGTGQIYASNTLGAICGSLMTGFFILPSLGSQTSLLLIATLNFLTMLFLFRTGEYLILPVRKGLTVVLAALVLFVHVAIPDDLLDRFFMRDSAGKRDISKLMFFEEGLTDTVAVFEDTYGLLDPDAKRLITNGISMSASNMIASRYMKLFAHVPILLLDRPDHVLVVCFGTGQTTGAAGLHPRVQSVDSLELSPSVVRAGRVFSSQNHDVLDNPKVRIILQDGRNHLLTTDKRYDVITSEPPPPRTAFTVNLYTKEYYELAKRRLRPGGLVAQWIPLHSQGEKEVGMHLKTFLSVFPHAIAWISVANEILIVGSDQPIEIDIDKLRRRFQEPAVQKALADIEIHNVYAFLSNLWFLEEELEQLAEGHRVITDNHPVIEFYLDLGSTIGVAGREKYVFNRTPFAPIARRIQNLTPEDRKILKRHYRMMDLYQRGIMYNNRGQLLQAMSLVPNDNLIRYHLQAGRDQVARLKQSIRDNPDALEPRLNLGHMYYQIGQYQKSVQTLKTVLEKDPKNSYANLYLGYNLLELDRPRKAKKYFQSAVKSDPRQLRTIMQEMALIELLNKLEKDPDNAGLLTAAAQFYNIKSQYLKALDYSFKALDQDPTNEKVLQSIIFSYRGLGEPGNVLDYANRYNLLTDNDIHALYLMGEIFSKTLRCKKAVPYLERVLKQDDTYRDAQNLLNQCKRQRPV